MSGNNTLNNRFVNQNYTFCRALPIETRLSMVRECRRLYGVLAGQELWDLLGFPPVSLLARVRQFEFDFSNDNQVEKTLKSNDI